MRYLLILLFMAVCTVGECADINWCLAGTESINITSGSLNGTAASINDDNEATQGGGVATGTPTGRLTMTATVVFDEIADLINKIEYVQISQAVFPPVTNNAYRIQLYYNGTWNTIFNATFPQVTKATQSQNGTWKNVEGIRVEVDIIATAGFVPANIGVACYEIRAFGPANTGNYIISFF